MKKIFILILILNLCSCIVAYNNFLNKNRQDLMKLKIGMTKAEVNRTIRQKGIGIPYNISNPYKSETLKGKDKIFEVWYYLTDRKSADGAITDDELTPLIFDDDKLIGWGQSFLSDTIVKYEIRIR